MRVAIARALVVLSLAALPVSGCFPVSEGDEIDGWQIGQPVDCADGLDEDEVRCDLLLTAAVQGFDRRHREHAPILEATVHQQAAPSGRSGGPIFVVVFRLADGSVHAIGVGGIGIEPGLFVFERPGSPGSRP